MLTLLPVLLLAPTAEPSIVEVQRIWDQAPHNAFTDLVHFNDAWFCVFREGEGHVSSDGALRVLRSDDGKEWVSVARIKQEGADLRDAKIVRTPDGRLMLNGAACLDPPTRSRHQSLAWFSEDGENWSESIAVADPNFWLWRVTIGPDAAYGLGYETGGGNRIRLYRSTDEKTYETWVSDMEVDGDPNESALSFAEDGTAICLLRREKESRTGLVGTATAPYRDWTWKDTGVRIGGPSLIRLPDGRWISGVRLYDGKVRTSLCELDPVAGTLTERIALPSGGDTSYPGLVWHEGLLWVSYYSSHEGKTSIYLAKVKFD